MDDRDDLTRPRESGITTAPVPRETGQDFVRSMVAADTSSAKYDGRVVTRFPPEPNGFLHIGHAKSICLNFGLAGEYSGGRCHLRFDDTNPTTEDTTYVEAIKRDIEWLGFSWGDHLYHASDYFEQLYDYGATLIRKGLAYVDSSTEDEIREARGSVTEPGSHSAFRDRSVEENLDLYERMRAGEFPNGAHVLRAKIDMAHPNMIMRDPILVRILHAHHYRQGDNWCVYPLYDFAHCLSDSIEGITHSLCTLEFENNRAIYDWLLDNLEVPTPRPEQTEFARLNLAYTITSKRKLLQLVNEGHVNGWDDPRMPTIAGFRRRGVTPSAIRDFCDVVGVTRTDSVIDLGKLEFTIRNDLNFSSPRRMAVLDPLRVTITNYAEGSSEQLTAADFPKDVGKPGARGISFSRTLWIDRQDFSEDPPAKYRRLAPGREVRLKFGYVIRCDEVVKDPETGEVVELRCTYDAETKGGKTPDGRKVAGTIHWVDAATAVPATVRLYDRLFSVPDPLASEDFRDNLNPESLVVKATAQVEAGLANADVGTRVQFERLGYFVVDEDSSESGLVFNRTVSLRDSWASRETSTDGDKSAGPGESKGQANRPLDAQPTVSPRESLTDVQRTEVERLESLGIPESTAIPLARSSDLLELMAMLESVDGLDPALSAKWLVNDVSKLIREHGSPGHLTGESLGNLLKKVQEESLSRRDALPALEHLLKEGGGLGDAISATKKDSLDDESLEALAASILSQFPDRVTAYRSGKKGLAGFFVGQAMKTSGGKADPKRLSQILSNLLDTPGVN